MKTQYIRKDSVLSVIKSPRNQRQMIDMIDGLPTVQLETVNECSDCTMDWTKCGTCSVMMEWINERRKANGIIRNNNS